MTQRLVMEIEQWNGWCQTWRFGLYSTSMTRLQCSPDDPVAILSFHSHSDRSFLDDRELALLSGILQEQGIRNDLVLAVIPAPAEGDDAGNVEQRLAERLAPYNPIVFERVWSPELIARLRRSLPGKVFIGLRGEHVLLDSSPADVFCDQEPARIAAPLVQWLRGQADLPPAGILLRASAPDIEGVARVPGNDTTGIPTLDPGLRRDDERMEPRLRSESTVPTGDEPVWRQPDAAAAVPEKSHRYAPNLRPVVINPESLPRVRTFSIMGNSGCPFQLDARDNPLYAGTKIPAGQGRGCAFCTTGNHYDGRPNPVTAAFVLEQIRHVRQQAPELELLVLKDQNPFGYLTEVIEGCASEGLSGFSLLLETRAEWFLRNAARFDRALLIADRIGVRIAPFLVGIESFSQPELDRFNKGTTAAANIEFLETLWRWKEKYGEALDLNHAAFGFILLSPWTTLDDLKTNLEAIRHTRLDRLRGSLLLSRARLYPDTALYYLAERDGLLAEEFDSQEDNASQRYGYYPSRPWKHLHPEVAHFAALATELSQRNHNRDVVNLFQALLDEFQRAGADWQAITDKSVWERYQLLGAKPAMAASGPQLGPVGPELRQRMARLLEPLSLTEEFAGGWRFAELRAQRGHVQIEIQHAHDPSLRVDIVPRSQAPCYQRSRHYDIRAAARDLTPAQHQALDVLAQAILANDR